MARLIVCIMGQDCEDFIEMCLESVKDADLIVYCDGGSTDNTIELVGKTNPNAGYISNKFDQKDSAMNGKQRNFYLKYLKDNYPNDWCLCLDADEVVEDGGIQRLKQLIQQSLPHVLSPRIHHFVGDFGHEDFTRDIHFAPNRLFKISEDLEYTEVEHSILKTNIPPQGLDAINIWHLRECLGVFNTNKKHLWNSLKSNMHSPATLYWWNHAMLLGTYPRKPVDYNLIPTPIKQKFQL